MASESTTPSPKPQRSTLALYCVVERARDLDSEELGDNQRTTALDTAAVHLALRDPVGESSPSATTLFGFLTGDIAEFQRFARPEGAKWLLDMAHGICGPHLSRGRLAFHRAGRWHDVRERDALVAEDYGYFPHDGSIIKVSELTAICDKHEDWRRFEHCAANTKMRTELLKRDGQCWISGRWPGPLVSEGLIFPVSLADATVQHIVSADDPKRGSPATPDPFRDKSSAVC